MTSDKPETKMPKNSPAKKIINTMQIIFEGFELLR